MTHKYRKKPVEIEAIQWKGDNQEEVFAFLGYTDETDLAISTPHFFIIRAMDYGS